LPTSSTLAQFNDNVYFVTKGEPPAMDSANVKRLSQLSTYLSSSETELGYVVDFTKPYIEIRSTYLSKSMHALSQTAASADRQHSGVYDRGSAEFLKYMTCLTKMFSVGKTVCHVPGKPCKL
jgi:hypothetical protein